MKEKLQKAQFAIRITLISFISLVLGFAIYQWNAFSLTGNVMPMPFGVGMGVVMSGSMEPDLSVNDVVLVVEQKEYFIGDVVVFQQKEELIVHEILRFEGEEEVVTKGKANPSEDAPIRISDLKGKVVHVFEGLGDVILWFKSPMVTFLILGIAGALLVFSYTIENKDEDKKDEQLEEIRKEIEALKRLEMEKKSTIVNAKERSASENASKNVDENACENLGENVDIRAGESLGETPTFKDDTSSK